MSPPRRPATSVALQLLSLPCPGCAATHLLSLDETNIPPVPILTCFACREVWCGFCLAADKSPVAPLRAHDLAHHVLRCAHAPQGENKWSEAITQFIDRRMESWDLTKTTYWEGDVLRECVDEVRGWVSKRLAILVPPDLSGGFWDSRTVRCTVTEGICEGTLAFFGRGQQAGPLASSVLARLLDLQPRRLRLPCAQPTSGGSR